MDFVQIGGSLAAIVILALIARWLYPNKAELTEDRVIRNVARYCPDTELDAKADKTYLSLDKKNAIFIFGQVRFGIATATALGDRVVVRHYADVSEVEFRFENGKLSLVTDDFTQPSFTLSLGQNEVSALLSAVNNSPEKDANHAHA